MLFLVQVVTESRHCQVEMRKKTFHTFNNRLWSIITIIISIAHPLDAHHELHQYGFPAMLNCNVFLLFAIKFIGLSMHRNEFGLQLFAYECKFKWYTNRKNWLYYHGTIIQSHITIQCMDSDLHLRYPKCKCTVTKLTCHRIVFLHGNNITRKLKWNNFRILK